MNFLYNFFNVALYGLFKWYNINIKEVKQLQQITEREKKLLLNTIKIAIDVLTEEEHNNILNICRNAIKRELEKK